MSAEAARQRRLLERLEGDGLDGLLVSDLTNVRYLTGYVGSNAIALISDRTSSLITDSRYAVSAREQAQGVDVAIGRRELLGELAGVMEKLSDGARIGVEADDLTLSRHERISTALERFAIVPTTGVVEDLRVVKDDAELDALRTSAAITDEALRVVAAGEFVGRVEREVAWEIEHALREAGAERASFDAIVAAGPRGARPHAVPSDELIPDDTLLVVDMGAVWQGYCSDMTRTFVLGSPPPDLVEAYRVCHRAQQAALAQARPGIEASALDAVARDEIDRGGMGEAFGHGVGHGVGLDVHERPGVRSEGRETIRAGMAITIEPGIYLEGVGGVRIEDLVLVTDGAPEVISKFPIADPPA
ncbi:MAG: Xaa-Pro peptidase family protein [Thermoleophilia bacterium]|nr:Xaa-Pro peptidase family protein [Thermoleophilia bacterium]